jgi:hypothetical protein
LAALEVEEGLCCAAEDIPFGFLVCNRKWRVVKVVLLRQKHSRRVPLLHIPPPVGIEGIERLAGWLERREVGWVEGGGLLRGESTVRVVELCALIGRHLANDGGQ